MKSLRLLSLAALLTTGLAAGSMAASQDSSAGPEGTGTKQQNTPATGSAAPTNQRMSNGGVAGLSAQTPGNGKAYPAVVGPTGSTQPDATNPNRAAPPSAEGNLAEPK